MLTKKFLATFFTFLGEHHGLCLAYGIADHAFLVEASQCVPVVSFPRASAVMECEKEKCEHHLIDFVFVVFHGAMLPLRAEVFNRASVVII